MLKMPEGVECRRYRGSNRSRNGGCSTTEEAVAEEAQGSIEINTTLERTLAGRGPNHIK